MRKLSLAVIGLYIGILSAFSQSSTDSSAYKSRKLRPSEINFVTGYYHQNGDHSPVTGGVGTEKLTDIATTFDFKLTRYDKHNLKNDVSLELGIDHYTSASTDKIDPNTISSASAHDLRFYPSASYKITNEQKGQAIALYASYSVESIYRSKGAGVGFTKISKDKNREFGIKLQTYLDKISLVLPVEFRTGLRRSATNEPRSARNTFSSSFTFSQVINTRLQFELLLDVVYQNGYLGTPFHRIYFSDSTEAIEKLPSSRFKIPFGMRLNYFLGDKFIIRSYYRFYHDNWGLTANTFNIEVPVKFTPFISISPFYRFYTQNGVKYYAPYMRHNASEEFYTTDDDLSKFNSNFIGAGVILSPPGGVFNLHHLTKMELRYGHYKRTDGLHSNIITLALKYK